MTNDQLVNILTAGAIPVFLALLGYAYKLMERADKRREAEEAEAEEQLRAAKAERIRYLQLREKFTWLRDRCVRRLQQALDRAEAKREPELVRGLQDAIVEIENVDLPPLE